MVKRLSIVVVLILLIAAPRQPALAQSLRTSTHPATGMLTFLGADPRAPLAENLPAEDAALVALDRYGAQFGIDHPAAELMELSAKADAVGGSSTRYQQVYQGVPVLAGELIVNLTPTGDLLSISGETSPDLGLSIVPAVSAEAAQAEALTVIAKNHGIAAADLTVSEASLWIYDARLLSPDSTPAHLVWRVEVSAPDMAPIHELVLVNAADLSISLHFNQVDVQWGEGVYSGEPAFDPPPGETLGSPLLTTYTANNSPSLPGTPLCNETAPSTATGCTNGSDTHADAAHYYTRQTYDYYATHHNRDSINNAGMLIKSSVHYRQNVGTPYNNAFWSTAAQQMVYGDAKAYPLADDVVAHELTHGVTESESRLYYYYQSGAINESFSDVWGEFLDQTNGSGTDTAGVKWLLGEDVAAGGTGAIRSMANPPAYNHPDHMGSGLYYTLASDNGGVHYNSGINNKAVYLMTDGGTFNGYTVTGIGYQKVAAIYYEVQTTLLTSGSDYLNLYHAVYQSCLKLASGGANAITYTECAEVHKALLAVEMNQDPTNFNPEAGVCPTGQSPRTLFADDFESGTGWTAAGAWSWAGGYATSGSKALYGVDQATFGTTSMRLDTNVSLPAGAAVYLRFDHAFGFETGGWDGGQVEYSTNGGSGWSSLSPLFVDGRGYNGTLGSGNPGEGQQAFINQSHGYNSSRYNLTSLGGTTQFRLRFKILTDSSNRLLGWVIDNLRIYTCSDPRPADFNGDGDSEVTIFRGGAWHLYNYADGSVLTSLWTGQGGTPMLLDYDGDGYDDMSLYQNGAWHFFNDDGSYLKGIWTGGNPGDLPVPADYDGDGDDDPVIYRGGAWMVWDFASGGWNPTRSVWTGPGASGTAYPAPMDYDADGTADFTIYTTAGAWHFFNDDGSYLKGIWTGFLDGIPVPGDYDGNSTDDVVLFQNGAWHWYDFAAGTYNAGLSVYTGYPPHKYGGTSTPEPLDYDGNGTMDRTMYAGGPWWFFGYDGAFVKTIPTGGVVGDQPISARPAQP